MAKAWDDADSSSEKKESKKNIITGEKLVPDTSKLLVRIIEDDATLLHKELGLTEENAERLMGLVKSTSEIKDISLGEILSTVSRDCNHANELALVCFGLGRMTSNRGDGTGHDSIGNMILNLLKESRKRRGNND